MFIAIDVGGTNIKIASFEFINHPKINKAVKFTPQNDYKKDVKRITIAAKKLGGSKIKGVGIGVPGVLEKSEGRVQVVPNLKSWENKPLKKDLTKLLNCPVFLENDTTAAALGEAFFGYGKNKNFLFIVWGTGIGGAEVKCSDDKLHLASFEPGEQIIEWNGEAHWCGQNGCLELYCGGAGVEKIYNKSARDLSEEEWGEVVGHFAHGLLNVITIRPSALIIFGGGVAVNQPKRIKQIRKTLHKRLKVYPVPEIKLSKYGENIGLYGALALVKNSQT